MSAEPDAHGTVSPQKSQDAAGVGQNGLSPTSLSSRTYLKSASISASKCVVVNPNKQPEVLVLSNLNSSLIIAND
uniref:Uncharacterized protein n=1 Tax=Aegilops tauschii subsp. strangulata TaxID=200361 RepID=A0A453SLR6_AEGTS